MPRIPSYIRAEIFDISDEDVLLGEDIRGTGKTMTYTFDVLKEYFGAQQATYVTSVNGFTGAVVLNTGDINVISDYNYVTDNQLITLSRWVVDNNNMNLLDEDEHVMTFVGRDATHEPGWDIINPTRFDIQVAATVPTGMATFTLQDNMEDALSFIASDYRMIRFVTTDDEERLETWKPVHLKEVIGGDDTMDILVIDPITGEIKSVLSSALGGGFTTADVTANIQAGAIDIGETVLAGTNIQDLVEQLLLTTYEPTKSDNYVTLSGVTTSTLEVGTLYVNTLASIYTPGSIFSANGAPTIDLTGPATTAIFGGLGINSSTGAINTNIIEGANVWNVIQDYSIGTGSYYDSDSVESFIFDGDRVAGSSLDNSNVITGKYKYWFSVGTIETTSAGVRALTDDGFWKPSTFDIAIPALTKPLAFYVPQTYTSITVLYVESSNADVTSTFTVVPMTVDDANAVGVNYDRWETTIPGIGYTEDATYRVNIT